MVLQIDLKPLVLFLSQNTLCRHQACQNWSKNKNIKFWAFRVNQKKDAAKKSGPHISLHRRLFCDFLIPSISTWNRK